MLVLVHLTILLFNVGKCVIFEGNIEEDQLTDVSRFKTFMLSAVQCHIRISTVIFYKESVRALT